MSWVSVVYPGSVSKALMKGCDMLSNVSSPMNRPVSKVSKRSVSSAAGSVGPSGRSEAAPTHCGLLFDRGTHVQDRSRSASTCNGVVRGTTWTSTRIVVSLPQSCPHSWCRRSIQPSVVGRKELSPVTVYTSDLPSEPNPCSVIELTAHRSRGDGRRRSSQLDAFTTVTDTFTTVTLSCTATGASTSNSGTLTLGGATSSSL
mmetsp:Transcript_5519/g.17893  ORF Transcript_5519/g.17893 Transcript_5519/m.17893 type:complete len:202 (-) Transcript_5519:2462-3067(-)